MNDSTGLERYSDAEHAAALGRIQADLLEQHARDWETLAAEQEDTAPGRARADTYRRTAESFRLEIKTGLPHCVCCLKPGKAHGGAL